MTRLSKASPQSGKSDLGENILAAPESFVPAQSCRAEPLLAGLEPLFVGQLAKFRNVFVLKDDPREAIAGSDFLSAQTLTELMVKFRPQFAAADQRGLASIWANQYFNRLFPAVISAVLLLDRRVPLRIEKMSMIVNSQGLVEAFKLPAGCEPLAPSDNPFARFAHLLEDHLQPFIEALREATGVPAKVLWSNAGNYFEAWLGQLRERTQEAHLLSDGERLLSCSLRPDGSRNPLYAPVRYLEVKQADGLARQWRQRRMCCIRYLLPEVSLCPNCPRLKQPVESE
ncbi:siderophore-iron reductase FhuF [Pseudomonas segetis]